MSDAAFEQAPGGALCPVHPDRPAALTCPRCGSFMCLECQRRTRPDAVPMCPACWELRSKVAQKVDTKPSTRLQTTALVLGCIAILPILFLQITALVVGIVALVKTRNPTIRHARWRPIVGLVFAGVGIALDLGLFYAAFHLR